VLPASIIPVVAPVDIDTPHGPARAHLHAAASAASAAPRGALVLGHGAGGGVGAPDLVAVTGAACAAGFTVVLVEQPYRVAGRRSAAPAHQLDAAWTAVLGRLREHELGDGLPIVTGGRSSGARVACRTAEQTGAAGVLCLAFPLRPPQRKTGAAPKSRLPELDAVGVPVLIVQGERDPFGMPPARRDRRVVSVKGNHSLRNDLPVVAATVVEWLSRVVDEAATRSAPGG
jgi:predicted alpha/beta-hydrolase family hydrolase